MKRVLDLDVFRIPGTSVFTTNTLNAIEIAIRAGEVVAKDSLDEAIEAAAGAKVPSHVFRTYTEHDLLMGMELTWPQNINKFDLGKIGLNVLGNHIVAMVQPTCLVEDEQLQQDVLAEMRRCFKKGIEYNLEGLLSYLGVGKNQPGHMYCSQFDSYIAKFIADKTGAYAVPVEWHVGDDASWAVSPLDDLNWAKTAHPDWIVPAWTKLVEDDYGYNTEITAPED
jgi:hypothetical protein